MSETGPEQIGSSLSNDNPATEGLSEGDMAIGETPEVTGSTPSLTATMAGPDNPQFTLSPRRDRATIEHLAVRLPFTPFSVEDEAIKGRICEVRTKVTPLLTNLRWGGSSIQKTADQL